MILAACSRAPGARPAAPPGEVWIAPSRVAGADLATEPVVTREIGSLRIPGRMALDEVRIARVFSPVDGRVVAVSASVGQRVKAGDPLLSIDVPESRRAARDALKAEADVVAAEHIYERSKELYERGEARGDMEAAEDQYRDAKATLEVIRAKARLSSPGGTPGNPFVLRAPIDGEVLGRAAPLGPVHAFMGRGSEPEPLFVVGERPGLWANADVPVSDVARVAAGQKVLATPATRAGKVFEGKVAWVSSVVDAATGTRGLRCVFPNPTGERDLEMDVTVVIMTGEKRLAVPRSAVVRQGERTVVFVRRGEGAGGTLRFERRAVEVDDGAAGEQVAVRAGVAEGEEVVRNGAVLLSAL
jgi:cobalt-zinc-cadmium efflux system membrane fusion protein